MLTMERKRSNLNRDISFYAKDTRLTEPSDGKRYNWKQMIQKVKKVGRPLTESESEEFRIK